MQLSHVAAGRQRRERAQALAMMELIDGDGDVAGVLAAPPESTRSIMDVDMTETQLRQREQDKQAEALASLAKREAQRRMALAKKPFKSHRRVSPHPAVSDAVCDSTYPVDGRAHTQIVPKKTLGVSRFRKATYKYNGSDEARKRYYMEKDPDATVDDILGEYSLGERIFGPRVPSPPPLAKLADSFYGIVAEEREAPQLYAPNEYDTLPPFATALALDRRERIDGTVRRAMRDLREAQDREMRKSKEALGHKRRSSAFTVHYRGGMTGIQTPRRPGFALRRAPYSDPIMPDARKQTTSPSGTTTSQPLPSISDVLSDMRIDRSYVI